MIPHSRRVRRRGRLLDLVVDIFTGAGSPSLTLSPRSSSLLWIIRLWPPEPLGRHKTLRLPPRGLANELVDLLADASCEVFFGDEAGFEGDPRPRRKWVRRSTRPGLPWRAFAQERHRRGEPRKRPVRQPHRPALTLNNGNSFW